MDETVSILLIFGLMIITLETFFTVFNKKGKRRGNFRRVEANPISRRMGLLPAFFITFFGFIIVALMADVIITTSPELYWFGMIFILLPVLYRGSALVWNLVW